jgi:hypothetical protein
MKVCIHIYIETSLSRKHCAKAVVPSVMNARNFKRQYDRDPGFVHTGVDRG